MVMQDRDASRRVFLDVWRKYNGKQTLEPMEEIILSIILVHPEYYEILEDEDKALGLEYTPEMGMTNPFLHMGMHITIKEQIQTDRPMGIRDVYQTLLNKNEPHDLEHQMMECLGETLWSAQRNNTLPDETAYMNGVRKLL